MPGFPSRHPDSTSDAQICATWTERYTQTWRNAFSQWLQLGMSALQDSRSFDTLMLQHVKQTFAWQHSHQHSSAAHTGQNINHIYSKGHSKHRQEECCLTDGSMDIMTGMKQCASKTRTPTHLSLKQTAHSSIRCDLLTRDARMSILSTDSCDECLLLLRSGHSGVLRFMR